MLTVYRPSVWSSKKTECTLTSCGCSNRTSCIASSVALLAALRFGTTTCLTATSSPVPACLASSAVPKPPSPSTRSSSYSPTRSPPPERPPPTDCEGAERADGRAAAAASIFARTLLACGPVRPTLIRSSLVYLSNVRPSTSSSRKVSTYRSRRSSVRKAATSSTFQALGSAWGISRRARGARVQVQAPSWRQWPNQQKKQNSTVRSRYTGRHQAADRRRAPSGWANDAPLGDS